MNALVVLSLLALTIAPPCAPLTPDDEAVIAAALSDEFSGNLGPPGTIVVLNPHTENWLPINLGEGEDLSGADSAALHGLRRENFSCAADLSRLANLPFPTADVSAEDDDFRQRLAADFHAPVTLASSSRPYLLPGGNRAMVAIGQLHSWNHCSLWFVSVLKRTPTGWHVVDYIHMLLS